MKLENIRPVISESLLAIAPEANLQTLSPDANLREELDLDSMDFLNFLTALHTKLHVELPESDYKLLATMRGIESYLVQKVTS
jgi:acyl carrier protein